MHNFAIPPLDDLRVNIYLVYLDDNNILSRGTQPYNIMTDTITIKNIYAGNNSSETNATNLSIETGNITNFNAIVGQYNFNPDLLGNTTIYNTDSNKLTIFPYRETTISGNISCQQLDTEDFNSFSHNQYTGIVKGTASVSNIFTLNKTLNLPQKTIFNNIPIYNQEASLQKVIVTNEAEEWAWGFMPVQTLDNIEEEESLTLTKEDFLKSMIPIIAENEDKQEFLTFSLPELEHSTLCSLIIEYDEKKQPLLYDEQGILAIALTQLPQIKQELIMLELLQEEGNKEIEMSGKQLKKFLIKTNECIFDFISHIKKIADTEEISFSL